MYGIVNENGEFTGKKDMAYLYPDLELAMVGQYKKGLMVQSNLAIADGQIGDSKNSATARVELFSKTRH